MIHLCEINFLVATFRISIWVFQLYELSGVLNDLDICFSWLTCLSLFLVVDC
uniref:Uncharacterized protein n=1 Tax=Manihot esculenta TaxID=3983 RepID=A0A2C9UBW3_MANES